MKRSRAIRIAVGCIDEKIKRLAVNANLYDVYHLDTPGTENASKERAELIEAKKVLASPEQLYWFR